MLSLSHRPIRFVMIAAAIVLYAGIVFGSLSTTIGPPDLFPNSDKVIHMAAWGLVAAIAATLSRTLRIWLAAAAGLFASSAGVEWAQGFIPGRSASWEDLVANAAGIAAAGGFCALCARARIKI
jgi:VanZ family protein